MAEAIAKYLNGVEERARKAEIAQAQAEAKAKEERKKRQWQLGLAGALLLFVTSGIAGGLWYKIDQNVRASARALAEADAEHRVKLAVQEADLLNGDGRTADALAAAQKANALAQDDRVGEDERERVRELVAKLQKELTEAERDRRLLTRVYDALAPTELPSTASSGLLTQAPIDSQLAEAFREYGLDLGKMSDEAILVRLRSRSDSMRTEAAAIFDAWAFESRHRQRPAELWSRLVHLARLVDPNPVRDRLRTILGRQQASEALTPILAPLTGLIPDSDHNRLLKLADDIDPAQTPILTIRLIAIGLLTVQEENRAIKLLRAAHQMHPDEAPLNWMLANIVLAKNPTRWAEAIPYLEAARGNRPELGGTLATLLLRAGRQTEAEIICQDMARRQPNSALPPFYLAIVLNIKRKYPEAEAAARRAILFQPDLAMAHSALAVALYAQNKLTEAEVAGREAVRLQPDLAAAHNNLGLVLFKLKRKAEAVAFFRLAIRLESDSAIVWSNLGQALLEQKEIAQAAAACRKAINLQSDLTEAHNNLGMVFMKQKKPAEATACFRQAIRLQPDLAMPHSNLGMALLEQKDVKGAEQACRKAINLQPDLAEPHNNLGTVFMKQKKPAEAVVRFCRAITLEPDLALAHSNLGMADLWIRESSAGQSRLAARLFVFSPTCPRRITTSEWCF